MLGQNKIGKRRPRQDRECKERIWKGRQWGRGGG